jgi:DNA-binding NarL/FixJ family response regulator
MHILIADDHAVLRQGVALLAQETFPHSQILQCACWRDVHHYAAVYPVRLMLLDLFMPGPDKWQNELQTLVQQTTDAAICILSSSSDRQHIDTAFQLGAQVYICKTATTDDIKHALLSVNQGEHYRPPQIWQSAAIAQQWGLTLRQQEVLHLLAQGKSAKQIAHELHLSDNTVKRHISSLYKSLNVNNRVEALNLARQNGLLSN